jgi:hypothetical protein
VVKVKTAAANSRNMRENFPAMPIFRETIARFAMKSGVSRSRGTSWSLARAMLKDK